MILTTSGADPTGDAPGYPPRTPDVRQEALLFGSRSLRAAESRRLLPASACSQGGAKRSPPPLQ
jgi:hypothetical protein